MNDEVEQGEGERDDEREHNFRVEFSRACVVCACALSLGRLARRCGALLWAGGWLVGIF